MTRPDRSRPAPSHRRTAALGPLVVIALLAALLAPGAPAGAAPDHTSSPDTARAGSRGPGYHQPKVGSCHQVTLAEGGKVSEPDRSVSCSRRHTTKTIGVFRFKGSVDWNSRRVLVRSSRFCTQRTARALKIDLKRFAVSAYSGFYFFPTMKERRRGAKWVRCDLARFGTARALATLSRHPATTVRGRPPYRPGYARCLARSHGDFTVVACKANHSYKAAPPAIGLRDGRYPGRAALSRKADKKCPGRAGRRYVAFLPSHFDWDTDFRIIICYAERG